MKKLKKVLALLMVGVFLLALTACGPTVSKTTLYNQNGIKIVATGMSTGTFGPEINLYIENNSGRNITVQDRNTSVNGYTFGLFDTSMSIDVLDGGKATGTLTLLNYALKRNNITTITEVKTSFHAFEMGKYGSTSVDTPIINIPLK